MSSREFLPARKAKLATFLSYFLDVNPKHGKETLKADIELIVKNLYRY